MTYPTRSAHPARPRARSFAFPPPALDWEAMEADLLRQALERSGGNRAAAAKLLGLAYKAFLYRLEKHADEPDDGTT